MLVDIRFSIVMDMNHCVLETNVSPVHRPLQETNEHSTDIPYMRGINRWRKWVLAKRLFTEEIHWPLRLFTIEAYWV